MGKRDEQVELPMAPMVALFVLLVVFMIQFYAASGATLNTSKGTALPLSTSTEMLEQAVQIEVTVDKIAVDGVSVANVAELSGPDMRIPGLYDQLSKHRERTERIAERNASVTFEGKAILLGDKRVKYDTITRIMYTSGLAGFGKINMAVVQKGGAPKDGG